MIDPRFYKTNAPLPIADIATLTSSVALGEIDSDRVITTVASLSDEDLSSAAVFMTDAKYLDKKVNSHPAVCFVSSKISEQAKLAPILSQSIIFETKNPKAGFALIADYLHWSISEKIGYGNQDNSDVDDNAVLHESVVVGAGAYIGPEATIGPNSVIGPGVIVGERTCIGANVTITHAIIGKDCRVLAGATIGEAGFGFTLHEGKQIRVPQLGRVILGDEVEIGSNTTIDRGTLSDTVIGNQTKIDNLVQIAHNVKVGERCAFASQTGISGSAIIGDDVQMGGRVGIMDHMVVGDGATIMALSAPLKNVPPNEKWGGIPAKPARQWFRELAAISKLGKSKRG